MDSIEKLKKNNKELERKYINERERIRFCSRCQALTTHRKSIPVREVKEEFKELITVIKGYEHWFTDKGTDYIKVDVVIEMVKSKKKSIH